MAQTSRRPSRHAPGLDRAGSTAAAVLTCLISIVSGCGDSMPDAAVTPSPVPVVSVTPSVGASNTPVTTATRVPSPVPTATTTNGPSPPTVTPSALCADRTGGALITFAICDGERLVVWSTASDFIDEAIALQAAGEQHIPIFATLIDGMDCDRRWTWHPAADAMSFVDFAIELCDGCPSHLEADKAYWLGTVRQCCPWSARVVTVDDRR